MTLRVVVEGLCGLGGKNSPDGVSSQLSVPGSQSAAASVSTPCVPASLRVTLLSKEWNRGCTTEAQRTQRKREWHE